MFVTFEVDKHIRIGDRTEAAIKTKSILGAKILEVTPRGDGRQSGPIPLDRTTSPYQLPDALGDLTTTISGLDIDRLSDSWKVLADEFADTPPVLKAALQGVARFSQTIDERDGQLRGLLVDANKVTAVLSERSDAIVKMLTDSNALLADLTAQSRALDEISGNITAMSRQINGLIAENRQTLTPALDKLDQLLTIVEHRKERIAQAIKGFNQYAMSLGRVDVGGTVLQVLHRQPAARTVHPAVRRRGLLRPGPRSERAGALAADRSADRPAGDTAAAGALPPHRPGRRTASDAAGRDHRQPR